MFMVGGGNKPSFCSSEFRNLEDKLKKFYQILQLPSIKRIVIKYTLKMYYMYSSDSGGEENSHELYQKKKHNWKQRESHQKFKCGKRYRSFQSKLCCGDLCS